MRRTGRINFLLDGFPRSLDNMEGWYEIFGREAELPRMLHFECPHPVLEQRILERAQYSGRSDDNIESIKLRFDTFKEKTLPTLQLFRSKNKVVEVDASQGREDVYALVKQSLAAHTDPELAAQPLTEASEMPARAAAISEAVVAALRWLSPSAGQSPSWCPAPIGGERPASPRSPRE